MNCVVIRGVTEGELRELPPAQLESQCSRFSGVEGKHLS